MTELSLTILAYLTNLTGTGIGPVLNKKAYWSLIVKQFALHVLLAKSLQTIKPIYRPQLTSFSITAARLTSIRSTGNGGTKLSSLPTWIA